MTRVCTAVIIGMVIRMEWSGGRHSICKQQSLLCLIPAQMMSVSTWTIHPVFWSHINFIHFSKCTCHYTVDCWRNFNKCLFLCVFTTDFCTLNWSRHSYEWDCLPGRSCTVSTPQPVMLMYLWWQLISLYCSSNTWTVPREKAWQLHLKYAVGLSRS